jgi:hypothetical protein
VETGSASQVLTLDDVRIFASNSAQRRLTFATQSTSGFDQRRPSLLLTRGSVVTNHVAEESLAPSTKLQRDDADGSDLIDGLDAAFDAFGSVDSFSALSAAKRARG